MGHDMSLSRIHRVPLRRPSSFAHCVIVLVFPANVMSTLLLRLFACSVLVAHLQFLGVYPRSLFFLSMLSS